MRRAVQRGVLATILAAMMGITAVAAGPPPKVKSNRQGPPLMVSQGHLFESQSFEGDVRFPARVLAAATGLKKGEGLSSGRQQAAERAITALYGKQPPGKEIRVTPKYQESPNGISVTWIISVAPVRHLVALRFEGNSRVSSRALAAATDLKKGDPIPPESVQAARQAILVLYQKMMPGKLVAVHKVIQIRSDGSTTLTWIIGEPK